MKFILPSLLLLNAFANQSQIELDQISVIHEDNVIASDETFEKVDYVGIDELQDNQVNSLDDALRLTPGATTLGGPRSSGEAIQVRGLDAGKVYLYIDGARQNFATDHSTMIAIDPEDLKSVKVNKSSSSFSHGGSLGGGIEMKTKDARDYLNGRDDNGVELKTSFQDANNEKMYNAKLFAVEGNSDYLFSLTERDASEIRLHSGDLLDNSSYLDQSALFKYNYTLSRHKFSLSYNRFEREDNVPLNPTLNPPAGFDELFSDNKIQREMGVFNYKYDNKSLNLKTELTASYTNQTLSKIRRSDQRSEIREITTRGLRLSNSFAPSKNLRLNIGHELNIDELNGQSNNDLLSSFPNGKSSVLSNHIDLSYRPIDLLEINSGVKSYHYELSSSNTALQNREENIIRSKLGLSLRPMKGMEFSGVYSGGYNPPKIQEIYLDGFHFPGDDFAVADNYFIPNLDLMPESSETFELSASYETNFSKSDLFKISASRYWTDVENYITLFQTFGDPWEEINGTTQAINIKRARLHGGEFSLDYNYDIASFKMVYSRVRGMNISDEIFLSRLPADTYTYQISFFFDSIGVTTGYQGVNALKQDRVNPQTLEIALETPSYFIHSFFFNKSFDRGLLKGLTLRTKVENFTNRYYRRHASNIDETGIDYKLGLSYKITSF